MVLPARALPSISKPVEEEHDAQSQARAPSPVTQERLMNRVVPMLRSRTRSLRTSMLASVVALALSATGCAEQSDVSFFVLVKSSNYAQDTDGALTLLNYHFFSEIFLRPDGTLTSATLTPADAPDDVMQYSARDDNYYVEGGHFDSQEDVDRAYPNGTFLFSIESPTVDIRDVPLRLAGPMGETDIPQPISVSLWQDDLQVHALSVEPERDLVVRWSEYSNGAPDPRGIVDDMIFLVIADCHGERIFHTGLPFQGEYTTFRTREMRVEAGALRSGQLYSAFVEFPHVVDSAIEDGVPGFTSYATATYLDFRTTGPTTGEACPDAPPPMDTGQTDRMDSVDVIGNSR